MSAFLKNILSLLKPKTPEEINASRERLQRAREVLSAELRNRRVDGKPVTHRRLETLMLAAGTGRKETVRLLRELGARPSSRHGEKLWTRESSPVQGGSDDSE